MHRTSYFFTVTKQFITHKKPEKLNQLASLSGFSSEASFYRNFKKFAGMSPEEWAKDNHID